MKSSKIIKYLLRHEVYSGGTGKMTARGDFPFMCHAVQDFRYPSFRATRADRIRTMNHIKIALGTVPNQRCGQLSHMLDRYGFMDSYVQPCTNHPESAKLLRGWWEDFVDYLESIGD